MHLETVHALTSLLLKDGDFAVDATVGWGNDFLHLYQCCGSSGMVWGFDIQQQALDHVDKKLKALVHTTGSASNSYQLFCKSHCQLGQHLLNLLEKKLHDAPQKCCVTRGLVSSSLLNVTARQRALLNLKCVVFNLGYLPKGDKAVITRPKSSCMAILQALTFLSDGGFCAITLYPGHEGGDLEALEIEGLLKELPRHKWQVFSLHIEASHYPSTDSVECDPIGGSCQSALFEAVQNAFSQKGEEESVGGFSEESLEKAGISLEVFCREAFDEPTTGSVKRRKRGAPPKLLLVRRRLGRSSNDSHC